MPPLILIADDDPTLVHALQSAIVAAGYRVVMAYDGEEALKKLESEHIDLVLLDIQMPKIHGYSLLFKMRKLEGNQDVPVIVLTSNTDMREMFHAEGVKDYLVKPCSPQQVLSKIRQYVNP
ncbi:MAG: response regulator [Candidatus Omnitrophica bacterium]|nr:response regulator [Candidatus Omnitrophota bacterium]